LEFEKIGGTIEPERSRRRSMKYRIGMGAIAGFLVAGCWALYALSTTPPALTSADPLMTLARLTCPIALLSFYPLSVYLVLLANAATYAIVGLTVEALRQRLNQPK
jgi:hypothetical protein